MTVTEVRRIAKNPDAYSTAVLAEALDFILECDSLTETQVTNLQNKIEPNFRARFWDPAENDRESIEYPDETDDSDITGEPAWKVSAAQLQRNYRMGMPAFPFSGDATTIERNGAL